MTGLEFIATGNCSLAWPAAVVHPLKRALWFAGIAALMTFGASVGKAQQGTSRPANALNTIPPGSYASWSDADRKNGEQTATKNCLALNAMMNGGPTKFDARATQTASLASLDSCIANIMPIDWPLRQKYLAEAARLAGEAKRIDPRIPDPTVTVTRIDGGVNKSSRNAMPTGPYASWSEEDRKSGLGKANADCVVLSAMAHGAPAKVAQANQEASVAFALSCVAKKMPSDWPQRASFLSEASNHAAMAKKLDPTYPDAALSMPDFPAGK